MVQGLAPWFLPYRQRGEERASTAAQSHRFSSDLCWGLLWAERLQSLGSPALASKEGWKYTQLPLA